MGDPERDSFQFMGFPSDLQYPQTPPAAEKPNPGLHCTTSYTLPTFAFPEFPEQIDQSTPSKSITNIINCHGARRSYEGNEMLKQLGFTAVLKLFWSLTEPQPHDYWFPVTTDGLLESY